MAKSGSSKVAVTAYDDLKFSWWEESQSIPSNYTVIGWKMELIAGSYGRISATATCPWAVTVNGQDYSGDVNVGIGNNQTKTLASGTTTIKHSNDGTKSFSYSFNQYFGITFSGKWITDVGGEGSGTLDTIPRTSSLTASNGTLGQEMTLTINRAASSFEHRLTFNISEEYKGYIGVEDSTDFITGTSVAWTPQIAYSRANTEGTSVSVKLTLDTYTSSGAHVGTTTKTISCAIPASVKPTCSLVIEDSSGYDDVYGAPVQGLSKIHFKVTATESYDSPISTYEVNVGDEAWYFTAEGTSAELLRSGNYTVTATVKDKRGRTGSASKSLANVLPYAAPSVTGLSVIRCDADGVENAQGKYVRLNFSATAASLNNKNTVRYSLKYKPTSETVYTEVQLTDLNDVYAVNNYAYIFQAEDSSSFDVSVTVADNHHRATRATSASTAFTFMDWHPTGTGIAFGKVSEKERTMEIAMHAEIQGTLARMGNQYSAYVPEGNANAASTGFDLMARITILGTYANAPLTFVFTRRGAMFPMTLHFNFGNDDTLDPYVGNMSVEGEDYGAYLVKSGTSIWDLYVARGGEYDFITLQSWYMAQYMDGRVSVTFPGGHKSGLTEDPMNGIYLFRAVMPPILLDQVYPVGSIYMAYSELNDPNMIFGGYWERITSRLLRAAGYTDTIGSEGGLADGSSRTYVNIGVWRRVS
jgi:hypothetical protein